MREVRERTAVLPVLVQELSGILWAAYNAAVWAIGYKRRSSHDLIDDLCPAEGARLKEKAKKEAERLLELQ